MKKVRVTALIICIIVTISMTGLLVNAGANEEVGKHLNLEHFLGVWA